MATLNNVNLFAPKDPKTGKTYELFDAEAIKQKQEQQKQQRDEAARVLAEELEAGNIKKAYEEGFTQLPIGEQLLYYINPVTGVPIETYETGYFTKEGGLEVKTPREMLVDVLNPTKNIFQKSFLKADDPVSAAIAPLSALGAAGGIGELANIPKAGLMALRRFQQKTMDDGGGGIGGLPEPKPQPALDDAGYKSSVLEEAKAVEIDSGQALLDYLTSPKRQNPSNNKGGTALKKSEIDEIDFDKFKAENPGDFTKEQLLQYIDDNRVQLYRVRRSENPDIRTDDAFVPSEDVDFYLDEPLTEQIYGESVSRNYDDMSDFTEEQKVFFIRNFGPEGMVTPETYQKYLDGATTRDGRENLRLVFENNLAADTNNPFYEVGEGQLTFTRPDGTIAEALSATNNIDKIETALNQGFTIQPKVLDKNLNIDDLIDRASINKAEFERTEGLIDEAYRYVGDDDIFEIIGSPEDGYSVRVNGDFDFDNFDENMSLPEAELQVGQYIDREYGGGLGNIDNPTEPDDLINLVPEGVIKENQSLPTKYSDYDGFRFPMGGATDYEEYTIHIKNPKTTTRYKLGTRDEPKHFGGGDELFHLRTTLRTDENGKKVLFVEEIQSDLHSTARSTQSNATYELSPTERQKTFEQLNNIFQDLGITGERTDTGDFIFKNKQGENQSLDADNLPFIARYIKEGRTENFGSKNANDFVETFGLEKTQEIGDMLAKLNQGNLPDFPYKKDWVDMAVKEAMKIGVEKGADRVAFVNAPTQIARNNKRLFYSQDRIITKVPTREEILASDEYAKNLQSNINVRYQDYVNDVRDVTNPNAGELPMSKEKFILTSPADPREYADIFEEMKDFTLNELMRKYGTGNLKYKLEDVGYALEVDEILNPRRIQMTGDDYDVQRHRQRGVRTDEELLAELPEKFREQVKKDLSAGKKEIILNIDDFSGSGKKFLEIYKNEIPRGINKVLKELKVKDVKPNISRVLFAEDDPFSDLDNLSPKDVYRGFLSANEDARTGLTKPVRTEVGDDRFFGKDFEVGGHSSIGIDLTPDIKQKIIAEGLPSMYMGGKVTKSKFMDKPIEGNRREM